MFQKRAHRGAAVKDHVTKEQSALEKRRRMALWVAQEVIVHEAPVRRWLAKSKVSREDAEELIQDAYCRLAMLDEVGHIERPGAYFFSIVRNLLVRRLKRERVVQIEAIAEIEALGDLSQPSPEQEVSGRLDYARMLTFMNQLPERCRIVVQLRKIEGWSQKEIAAHLDMTEKAVEKQVWLGIRSIQRAWSELVEESEQRVQKLPRERHHR